MRKISFGIMPCWDRRLVIDVLHQSFPKLTCSLLGSVFFGGDVSFRFMAAMETEVLLKWAGKRKPRLMSSVPLVNKKRN